MANRKLIPYKDTFAAPGSELYKALQDKNEKKAAQIYNECEKVFQKYYKKKVTKNEWREETV